MRLPHGCYRVASMDAVTTPTGSVWRQGWAAAKVNVLPAVLLWLTGTAVLLGYWFAPPVQDLLAEVAKVRLAYGFAFAAVSTATFGGLLPLLLRPLAKHGRAGGWRGTLRDLPFFIVFWGVKGIEVDLLYRGLALLLGDHATPSTILLKTLIDQGIYVPLWAVPSTVLVFLWKDTGYSLKRTRRELGEHGYRRRMLPVLLANWWVWTPTVVLIYALPLALQLPMQNLVLCLWSLMLLFMTRQDGTADARRQS